MPILDFPLEKLKIYKGINPRPTDFDTYWENALSEVQALDPAVELVKADFQSPVADCFHLYFNGMANARIHAKYLKPKKSNPPHPAVLMFHGYSGDSGDWVDKLMYTTLGFSVFALDCRGQGGLSQDPGGITRGNTLHGHIIRGLDDEPRKLYYRQVFQDTMQLTRIVSHMEDIDPTRLGSIGASQGGALSLACAALNPQIARVASAYPFLADYQRVWEMDMAEKAYVELKEYFRRFDPLHKREKEIFTTLGYIDIQHLADRIKGQVLLATGLMDDICPPSTQFAVYNKIRAPKQMLLYPDFKHEHLPGFADSAYRFLAEL